MREKLGPGRAGARAGPTALSFPTMDFPVQSVRDEVAAIVTEYRRTGDVGRLLERLELVVARGTTAELKEAVQPYLPLHEVAGPVYERLVEREPDDAQALVILGNAYWLTGRGPEVVGGIASRAIAADPDNRGGWHLWALSEPDARGRMLRWQQVVARFPQDDLAKATMADNAASVAAAEDDPVALALAIETFEDLRRRAAHPNQREALDAALTALKKRR